MLPFQVVEKLGFLALMKKVAPQYNVPSRVYFGNKEIEKMYTELRATVQEKVSDGVWFAATTDLWTSSCGGGEPYISFTIHYLSSEWKLMAHCLETMYFPEDHTHANIIEMVENLLNAWNIVCFTTDSGSNMKKAFQESPVEWLSCFGHNLNFAINKTMKIRRVEDAVRSCRKVVEAFFLTQGGNISIWESESSFVVRNKLCSGSRQACVQLYLELKPSDHCKNALI